MSLLFVITFLAFCLDRSIALPYDEEQVLWNLNQNQTATNPLEYWGQWENHCESLSFNVFHGHQLQHSIYTVTGELALSILHGYARPFCKWRPHE